MQNGLVDHTHIHPHAHAQPGMQEGEQPNPTPPGQHLSFAGITSHSLQSAHTGPTGSWLCPPS